METIVRTRCSLCGCRNRPDTGEQGHYVDCPKHAAWVASRHRNDCNGPVMPVSQVMSVLTNEVKVRALLDWAIREESEGESDALDLQVAAIIRRELFCRDF